MTSTAAEIRAQAHSYQNKILEGLQALWQYYDANYEWPEPELETYQQLAAALEQWPGRRAAIMRALEDDFLGREDPSPAQCFHWLDEMVVLQLKLADLTATLAQEQELLELALEQWLERMAAPLQPEPEEQPINNPAMYEVDLFGNPTEEYLKTQQEQH